MTMLHGLGHPVRMENPEDDVDQSVCHSNIQTANGRSSLSPSLHKLHITVTLKHSCIRPAQVADRGGGIWEALGLLLFSCVGSALRGHPGLTTAKECIYSSDFTPEATSKEHLNQLNDVP